LHSQTPIISGRGIASIAKNLIYLLSGQGFYFVTRFFYVVIIARVFGPKIYGMINYGIAWYLLFIPLTSLGMEIVLSRDVGRNRQQGGHTANLTLTLRIALIILATVLYFIISIIYETDPESRLIVSVFAFALIGRSLAWWTSIYNAYEANQYSFRQQLIFRSLEVVLGLFVIFIWREALLVVIVHGFVWCLEAIYGLTIIRRHIFVLRISNDFAGLKSIFMQGFPLGITVLLMTLPAQGPLIFFRHVVSSGDTLGQLALAMQALFVLSSIPSALGSVSLPILSRSAEREDGKDRIYAETMIRSYLLLGCIIALTGTAFGPWLTIQIFGNRYVQAGALIGPVLWLTIPYAIRQALFGVLLAGRQDSQIFRGSLIGAVFFAVTVTEAVLRYDALGSIISATAAMSLTTFYFVFVLNRRAKIDFRSSLIKPGLAVLSTVVTFYLLHFAGPLISFSGSFAVMLIVCYFLSCLTSQDVIWLKHSVRWIGEKISSRK
jgi:O-antigen/teichoic acid export membrane protein